MVPPGLGSSLYIRKMLTQVSLHYGLPFCSKTRFIAYLVRKASITKMKNGRNDGEDIKLLLVGEPEHSHGRLWIEGGELIRCS